MAAEGSPAKNPRVHDALSGRRLKALTDRVNRNSQLLGEGLRQVQNNDDEQPFFAIIDDEIGNNKIKVGPGRSETDYVRKDIITVVQANGTVVTIDKSAEVKSVTATAAGWAYYDVTPAAGSASLEWSDVWPPVLALGNVPVMVTYNTWADGAILGLYQVLFGNPTVYASTPDTDVLVKVTANDTTAGFLKDKSVAVGTFAGSTVTPTDTPLAYETLTPAGDEDLALAFDIDHLTAVTALGTGDFLMVSQKVADQSRKITRENLIADLEIPTIAAGTYIDIAGNATINVDLTEVVDYAAADQQMVNDNATFKWVSINPAAAIDTIGSAAEGSETAEASTWTAGGANGLAVYQMTRVAYYDAGNETLYGYIRLFTYNRFGGLYSVGAETRIEIDVPVVC